VTPVPTPSGVGISRRSKSDFHAGWIDFCPRRNIGPFLRTKPPQLLRHSTRDMRSESAIAGDLDLLRTWAEDAATTH
jgi:hypothetical protein